MIAEIRALVATILLPRVRRILDEQAVQPLLSADIAALIRALDDRELLALCAPELRRRLGLDAHAEEQAAEPLPAALPQLEDLGPLEDGPYPCPGCHRFAGHAPGCVDAEIERRDDDAREIDPVVYDNHCAELDAEDERAPISGPETIRADVAQPPSMRRLPVLSPEITPPIALHAKGPVPSLLVALPVEQLTSPLQRFRCVPFSAVLAASTCIERQKLAGGTFAPTSAGVQARAAANAAARCKSCPLGRSVAAQIARAS